MPMDKQLAIKIGKATALIQNPVKNATNPFLKNKYADLGTVIDCIKSELLKMNVVVFQQCKIRQIQPVLDVTTTLLNCDNGATASINVSVYLKELSPQGSLGAFTYGRRYGLKAMFMLADEDDDGNTASGKVENGEISVSPKTPQEAAKGINAILGKKS